MQAAEGQAEGAVQLSLSLVELMQAAEGQAEGAVQLSYLVGERAVLEARPP